MKIDDPKVIVIIDDEPETAEMFAEMMRLSGYRVQKAYSGKAAISVITEVQPDVVVMDYSMPDLTGLDVLQFLRNDPRLEHIPVIMVSAKSLLADIRSALDAGAVKYLTKPVTYQELNDAVLSEIESGIETADTPSCEPSCE